MTNKTIGIEADVRKALSITLAKCDVPNALRLAVFDEFMPRWHRAVMAAASVEPTDPRIQAWADRHGIQRDIAELRTIVSDARTLERAA